MVVTNNWKIQKRRRDIIKKGITYCALVVGSFVFAFPFLWLLSTSLKPAEQMFNFPPNLIPRPPIITHYTEMLNYIPFFRFFMNTVYLTVLNVVGTLISCSMAAYGFSRLQWPGRDKVFLLFLATMMIPTQVTMIPLYIIFKSLGWLDTFKPLWVPAFLGAPFYVFLLRQFFMTIPREIEDAAKIDGCNYFQSYYLIMLSLVKPALTVVVIFTFMATWNSFLRPLIYLNSINKLTLSLGLRLFQQSYGQEWGMLMANATLMTLPPVVIFFLAQRYFIQGITLSGLKG